MSKQRRTQRHNSRRSWPTTSRWLAVGTIAIYSAIGCRVVTAAPFQQEVGNSRDGSLATQPVRRFDIPGGTIQTASGEFEVQTGIRITLVADGIGQLSSPGASGLFTPDQALNALLKNTGVRWRLTGPLAVSIELNAVATSVDITADTSAISSSMVKFSGPLRDTPQTVNVVSATTMQEQSANTLRDALRNVPGISLAAGEGGAQGDNLNIRGFNARNDLYIDGMRDFGSYYRDPFNLQEVDVVQGPSSTAFGRGSTGGVVNQATKAPTSLRAISGTFDGGTDRTRRGTVDINTPVPAFGKGTAFRLNLMGTEGGVAGRDVAKNRRYGIAPTLALGLDTSTRWNFSYLNQAADDTPDYGIPWLFNQPAQVDRHNYYGFRDGNYLQTADNLGTVRFEHDFNPHLSVRNQARYARYKRNVRISEPQILSTLTGGTVTPTTPLASILINRNQIAADSTEAFLANQTDLIANFETGPVKHTVTAGVELDREDSDPTRTRYTGVPTTSLLNPVPSQTFAGVAAASSIVNTRANSVAVYAMETAKFGRHWELSGSVRYDLFNSHYTQAVAPAAAFNRLDKLPSFRGAIVYKPLQAGSIYFAAGTSFNPSAESLSLSASNANLPPEKNRTYEVGAKWDFAHPQISVQSAYFRTTKLNAREPDPANSLLNVLAGTQRVNGLQVSANGHLTSRWEALTGYAYLDATVAASKFYPLAIGARLANVPRHTFNFWHTYQLPWKTRIGAGGNFVGSRTSSSTVPLDAATGLVKQAPGYWTFNAMVERPLNEHVTLHANVYNMADRLYYDQLHPSHIILGPARSALLGLRFKF